MSKQKSFLFINMRILQWLLPIVMLFTVTSRLFSAVPTLQSLEEHYKQAQAQNNPELVAKVLRQMLDAGFKTVNRYKQLGDLFFYIKKDAEALNVFREQATWANTPETWENLSDLLFWKKQDQEGLAALETSLKLDPNNQNRIAKLAGKYEYLNQFEKSEQLWLKLYLANQKNITSGRQLIDFYLRNSKVLRAKNIMDELLQIDPELANSPELKVLNVKINSWLSKPDEAFAALLKLPVNLIADADLDYAFDLALYGGNTLLADAILDRLSVLGRDVFEKRLQLKKIQGVPVETRKLVEEQIKQKGESVQLLHLLYETYRAERDSENEVKTLEKIIRLDSDNPEWYDLLLPIYNYTQKLDQGIALFEDLLENNKDSQVIRLGLSRLYLFNQDYQAFEDMISKVTDPAYSSVVLDLRLNAAYQQEDHQKVYDRLKELLAKTETKAPEETSAITATTTPPEDKYLELLMELQHVAGLLGIPSDKAYWGKRAYTVLRSRFQKFPTPERAHKLLVLGEDYADEVDRERDFNQVRNLLTDSGFFLKHYRFLMKTGKYIDAEKVLTRLLASTVGIEEAVKVAEHTFGFVPYNLSKKLFRDIIARDPNYSMGLKRLGQIALYTDNYQEAVFYLAQYLTVNFYDPEATFVLAEALYFNRQPSQAKKLFAKVIELLDYPDRDNYEVLLMAISHLRLKKYQAALELLAVAQAKDPSDLSIKLNILETLVLLEKWQEALDLIKKENLDNELNTQTAKEVVINAGLDTVISKVDSESKANLSYEELNAIVNLQLALRVSIIQHLCLEGLGRDQEDRALLNNLLVNHPDNKELHATIGFYFLDRGANNNALIHLEKAASIPPIDPALNISYRDLKANFTSKSDLHYSKLEKSTNGQNEYSQDSAALSGKIMLNDLDQIHYTYKSVSTIRHSTETDIVLIDYDPLNNLKTRNETTSIVTEDKVHATAFAIAYQDYIGATFDLPIAHHYTAYLWHQDLTGYQLKYQVKVHPQALTFQLDWFSDIPNHDDFDSIQAETYDSGFSLIGSWNLKSMQQNYSLSYYSRIFRFENEDVRGNASQTQTSLGFAQSLMTYPNNLEIELSYTNNGANGELERYDAAATTIYTHFVVPYNQLQTVLGFRHHWSEGLNTGCLVTISSGENLEYRTANRTSLAHGFASAHIKLDLTYLNNRWNLTGFLNYLQEQTDEKSELTTANGIETESITKSKTTRSYEVGFTLHYLY